MPYVAQQENPVFKGKDFSQAAIQGYQDRDAQRHNDMEQSIKWHQLALQEQDPEKRVQWENRGLEKERPYFNVDRNGAQHMNTNYTFQNSTIDPEFRNKMNVADESLHTDNSYNPDKDAFERESAIQSTIDGDLKKVDDLDIQIAKSTDPNVIAGLTKKRDEIKQRADQNIAYKKFNRNSLENATLNKIEMDKIKKANETGDPSDLYDEDLKNIGLDPSKFDPSKPYVDQAKASLTDKQNDLIKKINDVSKDKKDVDDKLNAINNQIGAYEMGNDPLRNAIIGSTMDPLSKLLYDTAKQQQPLLAQQSKDIDANLNGISSQNFQVNSLLSRMNDTKRYINLVDANNKIMSSYTPNVEAGYNQAYQPIK